MKAKILICIIAFLTKGSVLLSQSLYHFRYNCQKANDTVTYHAFLILKDDGTGLMRVKYKSPLNGDSILIGMNVQQQYPDMKAEKPDNSKFSLLLSDPKFIKGNAVKYNVPLLWFKKSASADEFEPWGVTINAAEILKEMNVFSAVDFLDAVTLKKDKNFVLQYFTRQDDFYTNLFEVKTKDLSSAEKNFKLTLLVVANINDPLIGGSCQKDMRRSIETFKRLTMQLGIKFDTITISGNQYNLQNVNKAIDALTPGPNDIVVFYYTGHGFRKPGDSRRFPWIDLRTKIDNTYMVNSLNMEDILKRLDSKPVSARLNLVLSDCCNSDVEVVNSIGTPIPGRKSLGIDWSMENARALFLNTQRMSVIATAADRTEKASSNNDFGGFFSFFFKVSMEAHCSNLIRGVSWDKVLDYTRIQTSNKADNTYCEKPYIDANICIQNPYYKVIPRK